MFGAYAGTAREANDRPCSILFDTDSHQIVIDNFAYGCISPNRDHFINYKASEVQECKSIALAVKIEGRGTLKFRIDDDDGITHSITVPNSVHIPDLPMVLVSPQHWVQQTSDETKSTSSVKSTILNFQGKMKTIPYSMQSNTPSFCSTSMTFHYQYFVLMVDHRSAAYKTLL